MDPRNFIDHPSGFLAMSSNNRRFSVDGLTGFIAYRDQGKHRVALAGVHSPSGDAGPLLDAFLEGTRRDGLRPLFVQLPRHQIPLCVERGMTVNQLGSTYAVSLQGYSFRGTSKMTLRNKIKRGRTAGLSVVELGAEMPWSDSTCRDLEGISHAWLAAKMKKELEFMVGEPPREADSLRRVFVVRQQSGAACAFVTYVPAWGRRPGYLHDLSRRLPDSPVGTMEICNAFAIERFMKEGVAYLHFGFTPFVADGEEPVSANRMLSRILYLLRRYGRFVYPAESQVHYKSKWGTDVVEPEYIAARPLSLRAAYDLMRLTNSL